MGKSAAATLYLWCVSWPDCVFHRVDAQERLNRKESKCRGRSVQENLAIWEEMKKGSEVGVMNCLRFKFDMKVRAGFGPAGSWRQTNGPLRGSTLPWVRWFCHSVFAETPFIYFSFTCLALFPGPALLPTNVAALPHMCAHAVCERLLERPRGCALQPHPPLAHRPQVQGESLSMHKLPISACELSGVDAARWALLLASPSRHGFLLQERMRSCLCHQSRDPCLLGAGTLGAGEEQLF